MRSATAPLLARRYDDEALLVACLRCRQAGAVAEPCDAVPSSDREQWPDTPCFFTEGCTGMVYPEPVN